MPILPTSPDVTRESQFFIFYFLLALPFSPPPREVNGHCQIKTFFAASPREAQNKNTKTMNYFRRQFFMCEIIMFLKLNIFGGSTLIHVGGEGASPHCNI